MRTMTVFDEGREGQLNGFLHAAGIPSDERDWEYEPLWPKNGNPQVDPHTRLWFTIKMNEDDTAQLTDFMDNANTPPINGAPYDYYDEGTEPQFILDDLDLKTGGTTEE